MELETLLYFGALLACPIGMGAMMWMMSKNMGGHHNPAAPEPQKTAQSTAERLATLRTQRQALEAEIVEVTQLVELEARRDALRQEKRPVVDEPVANHNMN
jgi:hypothetical protein